jgi:hypothetical protein
MKILLDINWPQVTETTESKNVDKGGYYIYCVSFLGLVEHSTTKWLPLTHQKCTVCLGDLKIKAKGIVGPCS